MTEEIKPEPDITPTPTPDTTPDPDTTPCVEAEITSVNTDSVSVSATSNTAAEYKMITAVYSEDGALICAKIDNVQFEKNEQKDITVNIDVSNGNAAVFFWKDEMTPVSNKIVK